MRMALPLILLLMVVFTAQAQPEIEPLGEPVDPNASIISPPPVFVVRGEVTVEGSANLPDMVSYFLEYRPLNEDLTADEEAPWLPATLPNRSPVENGTLGVWDTSIETDGVYELRLTINVQDGDPVHFRVSPLRVENAGLTPVAPTQAATPIVLPTIGGQITPLAPQATATAAPLLPTPTQFDPTPRVTANVNANVRASDNTNSAIVGSLPPGESAPILGISSTGSGWYYIELANGSRGWIAGGIVQVEGSLNAVPRIAPPATPTPTFTPTPSMPDITLTGVRYDRGEIKQGEGFRIIVRVRNNSGVSVPDNQVLCTVAPSGSERSAFVGTLNAFEERDVTLPELTLNSGGGANITVNCAVDVNRVVAETDENNNYFSITTPLRES
jgi:uncharacterized protein YgiM (DUF1202 family)